MASSAFLDLTGDSDELEEVTLRHPSTPTKGNGKRKRVASREASLSTSKSSKAAPSPPGKLARKDTVLRTQIFAGLSAFFVPLNVPPARLSLLKQKWQERGGTLVEGLATDLSFLISPMSLPKLMEALRLPHAPAELKVVKTEWVSQCILTEEPLPRPRTEGNESDAASDATEVLETETPERIVEASSPQLLPDPDSGALPPKIAAPPSNVLRNIESSPPRSALPFEGVLIDTSESDDSGVDSAGDNATGPSAASPGDSIVNPDPKVADRQNRFICMQKNARQNLDESNRNKQLTDILDVLLKRHEAEGEHFRVLSYRRAIQTLKRHPKTIENGDEARKIFGIGGKIADKIDEIISTGRLRKAEIVPESLTIMALFQGIHGCGKKAATTWYAQGCRTLDDIRARTDLNHDQIIGLRYYDDLQKKMPREEAAAIGDYVINACKAIDPRFQCTIMGSFRRGRPMCGDVDIIITHPDGVSHAIILRKLLTRIKADSDLIVADLHTRGSGDSSTTFMGVCKLPGGSGLHRRLDIWTVPFEEMGSALLHWTGNDIFNRSMRALASTKGMSLSQHGLFDGVIRQNREKIHGGRRIASRTEEEIFEALGVPYRPPAERDC
ncbi:hypothetical protein HKX48_005620 [Thoreauomyces humboldtii]|nr:hypothetical protein HKX48_005620 [Thoreauomyces humboldtii]